ncbi:MAG: hypothetical protein HY922_08865 [Elusimicrobia bacterium]|nr:hypothetical protein [Elusimicrobiota bacterium]
MTPKALLLSAFVSAFLATAWTQEASPPDQSPQRPVPKTFFLRLSKDQRQAAGKDASLERMAAMMDAGRRSAVRNSLLELETVTEDMSLLTDIAQGYLALEFPEEAARIARLLRDSSPKKAALLSKSAGELHNAGKVEEAAAAAAEAFRLDPQDKAAEAIVKLSERRFQKKELALLPKGREASPVDPGGAGNADALLRGSKASPLSRVLPPMTTYHLPDTKPPSIWSQIGAGVGSIWDVMTHRESKEETAALQKLRDTLVSTPSGAEIIRSMGGWERVDKEVFFMFSKMPNDGTAAYVRPMTPWEEKRTGKKIVLAVNSKFMQEAPEMVVPVFGHELWHVADKLAGHGEMSLAVTSEHGAHLRQAYLFQEVDKRLTPQRRKELEKNRLWMYQKWVTSMWEDHLLKLYPKKEDYQKVFDGSKNLQYLAGLAYEDIHKKAVQDGTPQVLYHVSDLYANATNEPEVTEEQLSKAIAAETNPAKKKALQDLLAELLAMRKGMFGADNGYRTSTGQTLP